MLRSFAVLALVATLATPAAAKVVEGVTLADTATLAEAPLVLNGAGVRTRMFFKVYVGSLYLPAKAANLAGVMSNGTRRIQLNLLRNLSAETLIGAFNDGLKENVPAAEFESLATQRAEMAKIMTSFGEVKEGSVVTLDFNGGNTSISLNGKAKGSIAGAAFNAALTKIWLGEKPVQDDLKKAMLGS
jgi:Chalcone isomerase-like